MARPNNTNHVVTEIREILGLTRPELANLSGISSTYLSKIEAGVRPITRQAAAKISIATGVDSLQIEMGSLGRPFVEGLENVELTREWYDRRNVEDRQVAKSKREDILDAACGTLWGINRKMLSSALDKKPTRFHVAHYSIIWALKEVSEELGLSGVDHAVPHTERRKKKRIPVA